MKNPPLTASEKIAILRERGDVHCRRYEAALSLGHAAAARREMRAFQAAYAKADLVRQGYVLAVRIVTRDEALAAETARVRDLYASERLARVAQ